MVKFFTAHVTHIVEKFATGAASINWKAAAGFPLSWVRFTHTKSARQLTIKGQQVTVKSPLLDAL